MATATVCSAPEARGIADSDEHFEAFVCQTTLCSRQPSRRVSERSALSAARDAAAASSPKSEAVFDAEQMPSASSSISRSSRTSLSALSAAEAGLPKNDTKVDVDQRWPSSTSLLLVLYSALLAGANLVIVIPTADDYAKQLGGDELLSGLMIGAVPLSAMAGIVANQYLLRRGVSFKSVMLLLSVGSIIGNLLYALAALMHFKWSLVVGRCVIGISCGLNLPTLYISLTVGIRNRSQAILYFSAANTLGFAVGPALASAFDAILKSTRVHNLVLDSDTAPGWFMAAVYLLFMVKLILLFEDLPVQVTALKPSAQSDCASSKGGRFPIAAACAAFWYCAASGAATTMTEVYAVKVAKRELGWSTVKSGLALASILLLSGSANIIMGKLTQRFMRSDRASVLGSSLLGSVACVLLFAFLFSDLAIDAQVTMLGVGLLLVITLAGFIRGYGLAISSKLAPVHLKSRINSWTIAFLTLGRGFGGILGSVLQTGMFAPVMLGLFVISLLISIALYGRLKAGKTAS